MDRTLELLKQQKARYEKNYGLVDGDGEKVSSGVDVENASMD